MSELKFEKEGRYWAKDKRDPDSAPELVWFYPDQDHPIFPMEQGGGVEESLEDWTPLACVDPPKPETPVADVAKLYGFEIDWYPGVAKGEDRSVYPSFNPPVMVSPGGNPYFERPGVVMIAKTQVDLSSVHPFLRGFHLVDESLDFEPYLDDFDEIPLYPAERLIKFAGQTCYLSFDKGRTWNKDAQQYFDNLLGSVPPHGSVLEHANFSILFYGVSRSFTHELVRHRAGVAFSQVSQRYVDGRKLRFVMRPEYLGDKTLAPRFHKRVDFLATEYDEIAEYLKKKQAAGDATLSGEKKRDLKKKVQQCARSALPNETEAPIVVTANVRSWRHMIEMRANPAAEIEIRAAFVRVCYILKQVAPMLFNDHKIVALPDGTMGVETPWRKV